MHAENNYQKKMIAAWGWVFLSLAVALLIAAGVGFIFPIWYGIGNKENLTNYGPQAQEPWGPFSCTGDAQAVVGQGDSSSSQTSNVIASKGYQVSLSAINTNVLQEYPDLTRIKSDLINPYKSKLSDKYNTHLFWGDSCNRLGKSVLSEIENQGECQSCWAFALATISQAAVAIDKVDSQNNSVLQSVQYILNQTKSNCGKGTFKNGLLAVSTTGIPTNDSCVYTSSDGSGADGFCTNRAGSENKLTGDDFVATNLKGFHISTGSLGTFNAELKQLLQIWGPLAVSIEFDNKWIDVSKYQVIGLPMGYVVDHEVVLVGYSRTENQDYWILQNSCGEDYGNQGFFAIGMTDRMDIKAIFGEVGGLTAVTANPNALDISGQNPTTYSL